MFVCENELGVIVVFAQEGPEHGFYIKKIQSAFPDAIIEKDGRRYRAEFEFMASAFDAHGHDHRECDLIVCWENDCTDDMPLPILALSDQDWMNADLTLSAAIEREAYYWRRRALRAERALKVQLPVTNNNGETPFKTASDHVRWLHQAQPGLARVELARMVGCSASTVTRALMT